MCLSVYVEPHLPRVRSLRIFDSLRAIIAFREACDPHCFVAYVGLRFGVCLLLLELQRYAAEN